LTELKKRAERRGLHRFFEIRVLEDNQRRLAAEFEQTRLEVLRRPHGDDRPPVEPVKLMRLIAG
jgi:hypothetical protein